MPASMPVPTSDAGHRPIHDLAAIDRPIPRRQRSGLRRSALALGACGALGLLAGCETVSLNAPAPVVVLHPASAPSAAPAIPASQPAGQAPAQPAAQSQGLQPTPGVEVQPLGPASAASMPASAPAGMASMPASAPAGMASAPMAAPSMPAAASSPAVAPSSSPAAAASAPPPAAPPGSVRFVCNDGTSFLASFGDVSVTMSTALGVVTLDQTVAADGARYANSQVQVWFKGRQATITNLSNPGSAVLCLEQR